MTKTNAQSPEIPISLGIGGAYSYIPSFENSRIVGYTLGIYSEYPVAPKLNLFSGLVYNLRGGENGGSFSQGRVNFDYRYNQLAVPVMMRYDVLPRLGIHVGVYGGYRLQGRLEYQVEQDDISKTRSANDPNYKPVDEFHDFEFGSKFGLRINLTSSWFVELDVAHAWRSLYDKDHPFNYVLIKDNEYYDYIDQTLRIDLDRRILDGKNIFVTLVLKKTLVSF